MCVHIDSTHMQDSQVNKKVMHSLKTWACACPQVAPANPSPVLHRSISLITLMHTCLGISMIPTGVILNPAVSSKHVAETESPKYHVSRGVQEFFCLVGLF